MSEALRVPTAAVAVELALADGAVLQAHLFVPDRPRAGRTALALEVAAMLDVEQPFLPARESGHVVLYARRAIASVAIKLAEIGTTDESSGVIQLFDQRHDVEVQVDHGPTLLGQLLYTSPTDRPRVVDHLNQPGAFLRLWTATTLYVVSKQHVVRVREIG